jgi:hypothetical protein
LIIWVLSLGFSSPTLLYDLFFEWTLIRCLNIIHLFKSEQQRLLKFWIMIELVGRQNLLQNLIKLSYLPLHITVPVILYIVISPPFNVFANNSPLISINTMLQKQNPFFFITPTIFFYIWIQMIMPSFSALFPDSTR